MYVYAFAYVYVYVMIVCDKHDIFMHILHTYTLAHMHTQVVPLYYRLPENQVTSFIATVSIGDVISMHQTSLFTIRMNYIYITYDMIT